MYRHGHNYVIKKHIDVLNLAWLARLMVMDGHVDLLPPGARDIWQMNLRCMKDVLPKTVQLILFHSPLLFLVMGGFAAFHCGLTNTYNDIDLFTVVALHNVDDVIWDLYVWLKENLDYLGIYYLWPCRGYVGAVEEKKAVYNFIQLQTVDNQFIDVVVFSPVTCNEECLRVRHSSSVPDECKETSNAIAERCQKSVFCLAETVVGYFDFDICKCVGIPYITYAGVAVWKILFWDMTYGKSMLTDEDVSLPC